MLKKMMFVMCFLSSIAASYGMESMSENPENTAGKNSSELKWPGIAYDGDEEPERIKQLHKRLAYEKGCQLPRNQEEFDLVYTQYKAGNFTNDLGFYSWHYVMEVMGFELAFRLQTGNMVSINNYLDYIENFLTSVAKCEDHAFTDPLFHPIFTTCSLAWKLIEDGAWMAGAFVSKKVKCSPGERSLTVQDGEKVIDRLNSICNKSGLFEQDMIRTAYVRKMTY